MSTCQAFPTKTKAQAIEGFCDEFPGFCEVSATGVESVPSDVEETILLDDVSTNDKNDCDGGFDFELACPTACGQPETTVSATYRVVADAFGGGEECPYHDGFEIEKTCPATPACPSDCSGGEWRYTCPNYCGYEGGYTTKVWTGGTPAVGDGKACPSPTTHYCPAKTCAMPCGGYWSEWSGCPSCGTTSSSHSQSRTWTTSSTLPSGYYYSPACPSPTERRYCPATPACAVDCQGGNWNRYSSGLPECPTNCSYPGATFSRQWVNATPATGGGKECPSSETKTCNAAMTCSDMLIYNQNYGMLKFTSESRPDPSAVSFSAWSVVNVGGKDAWQWTSPYDYYRKYKLNSYVLKPHHRYEHSWFPIVFRMVGVSDRGEDVIVHEFDLEAAGKTPYNFMYYPNGGETVYQTSGYSSTLEYVDTTGTSDWEMHVSCGTEARDLQFRQLKFQMFSIVGRNDCIKYGSDCSTYYTLTCDAQTV
jgi:hypothetical protein